MHFLNYLRQRRARYAPVTITRLGNLRAGTDATLAGEEDGADFHIGPVARVIAVTSQYAVYVDGEASVRYVVTEANQTQTPPAFNLLWSRVTDQLFLIAQLRETHRDAQLDMLRIMLGGAISCGLEGDFESMAKALDDLGSLLLGKVQRNCRRLYVSTAIRLTSITVVVAMLLLVAIYGLGPEQSTTFEEWLRVCAIGGLGGSIGATLSILTAGTKEVPFDPVSSAAYARFEARVRVATGIVAGVVMAICTVAGFLSSSLTNDNPEAGTLFFAIVAGFVERLVPSLLSSGASQVSLGSGAKAEDDARKAASGAKAASEAEAASGAEAASEPAEAPSTSVGDEAPAPASPSTAEGVVPG